MDEEQTGSSRPTEPRVPVKVTVENVEEFPKQASITYDGYPLNKHEVIFLEALKVSSSGGANRDPEALIIDAKLLTALIEVEFKDER